MSSERGTRLSYEDSCRLLQRHGYLDAGAEGVIPPIPSHRPQIGDEEPLGVSFFRTWVGVGRPFGLQPSPGLPWEDVPEHALENLTLPRTFFGRSEIGPISFKNTNLSESTLCWNDFIEVNFTDADLSGADLRASIFRRVAFVRANLRNADLRRSSFEACDFSDADMAGAKLTRKQGEGNQLSDEQRKAIDWQESDGDEPPGG
jgi:BTB/POZ domain-containing protein KCTD9